MKQVALALAVLGIASHIFSALPAATDPTLVAVPQTLEGYFLGATVSYLQHTESNNDLDYATISNVPFTLNFPTPAVIPFSRTVNTNPGYDWGFGFDIGYVFHNGSDLGVNYFNLDSDLENSVNTAITAFPTGSYATPVSGVDLIQYLDVFQFLVEGDPGDTHVTALADYDIDGVDAELGQYIDVGCRLTLHPNMRIRLASIERKLLTKASVNFLNPSGSLALANENVNETSNFLGLGPILGLDASYYIGSGFGMEGHFDGGVLVGDIESDTAFTADINIFSPDRTQAFFNTFSVSDKANNIRRAVPTLNAKLGGDYTFVFNNAKKSNLTIEAGWQANVYFNSVDRIIDHTVVLTAEETPEISQSITHRTSNLLIQGPYVSLEVRA